MSATWHYSQSGDGFLRVRIDREDRPVNALSRAALQELAELIDQVRRDGSIKGVLFRSGKPGSFIVGADVSELNDLITSKAARETSQFGQTVFQELSELSVPTVALISGACLGGGLEFSMACKYRIADEDCKTLLGLPEVKLGLIPGWGGTVRLPKIVGLTVALPMILTGKMLNGKQAWIKGLIHDVVSTEALDYVGERILHSKSLGFQPRRRPVWKCVLENNFLYQSIVFRTARKQVQKKTHGHYPAPLLALDTLRSGLRERVHVGFAAEADTIARLAEHPVTTELMRLFFLQEDAKKPPADLDETIVPESINHAGVIGAGAMGAGIALLMAKRGVWTRLKDLDSELVAGGVQTIRQLLRKDIQQRRISRLDATNVLDHISLTTDYSGLKRAEIVIEAVVEDLAIKRQVFLELAKATSPTTVLATNTSSLLVHDIGRDVPHPERVIGLHFFNPPHQIPLIEIVRTDRTSPQALATVLALVARIGKTKVVVRDCAGFLVNRLLAPYMNEAGYLLHEVSDPMEIERTAIEFGMPIGPLELADLVGLNVAAHVSNSMHTAYGDRMQPAPVWHELQRISVGSKEGGLKLLESTWRGKRIHRSVSRVLTKMRKNHPTVPPVSRETIIHRLVFPIINEAALCLEEGIVDRPDDIDLAMVFGTGFAPFRGGPLRYADSVGIDAIVEVLDQFVQHHPRLAPAEVLRRRAVDNRKFYKSHNEKITTAIG